MAEPVPSIRIGIFRLVELILRWRKLFIGTMVVAAGISAIVALVLPVQYRALAVILPPSGSGSLPAFLPRELANVATTFGFEIPFPEIYQTILTSRTLKERLIKRFNLREVYRMPPDTYMEDVIREVDNRMKIKTNEDQSISILFTDRDPNRAAALANACVEELDSIWSGITSETARKNRIFLSRRVSEITDTLKLLQDSIAGFQLKYKAISISDQTQALIKAAADLKAEELANRIKLQILRNSLGDEHPAVKQLSLAVKGFQERADALMTRGEGSLFLAIEDLPEISRQYADLIRLLRIYNTLLEYTYPQYEAARLQEVKEGANVQVLDWARPPDRKYWPPRKLIVLGCTALAFLFSLFYAAIHEYWETLPKKNPEEWNYIESIQRILRSRKTSS
ncbi:MAG: GumC family protein [bacterium]